MSALRRLAARLRRNPSGTAILGALSVAMLWLFPYWPRINNPNENVRMYMTRAMVDHGTMAIGVRTRVQGRNQDGGSVYEELGYVNDKALTCADPSQRPPDCSGLLYSAKAPGTSYLGVPVYAAVKAAYATLDKPLSKDATIWWLRLAVALPAIAFLWLFYAFLGRFVPERWIRNTAVIGLGLGTMHLTYGMMFAGHVPASIALFGAFALVSGRPPVWRFAASGFLVAASVAFEYPTLLMTLPVLIFAAMARPGIRGLVAFAAGGLPPVIGVAAFHHVAFGAAWHTPYTTLENPGFVRDIAPGFMGLHAPTLEAFWGSFFVPFNGMFFFSPWMALILPAAAFTAWRLIRRAPDPARAEVVTALSVALLYTIFITCHSLWRGGWTLGPRYIVGFVPFAAFAIAVAASRLSVRAPRPTAILLGASVAASVFVTFTCSLVSQGFPFEFFNPFVELALPMVRDGWVARNAGNLLGLHGLASVAPLLLIAAALALVALAGPIMGSAIARLSRAAVAALLATAIVVGLTLPQQPWTKEKADMARWLQDLWVPPDQSPVARRLREARERQPTCPDPAVCIQHGNDLAAHGDTAPALRTYRAALLPSGDENKR
ncbi:MAG: hypothetical protein AMXMBFR64_13300 [Myxococcales bacterium]